jgi:hypothetical protein
MSAMTLLPVVVPPLKLVSDPDWNEDTVLRSEVGVAKPWLFR